MKCKARSSEARRVASWRRRAEKEIWTFLGRRAASMTIAVSFSNVYVTDQNIPHKLSRVQSWVKTFLLRSENQPQNVPFCPPKMHYGKIFQPAIPETCQECFYTTLYMLPKIPPDLTVLCLGLVPMRRTLFLRHSIYWLTFGSLLF